MQDIFSSANPTAMSRPIVSNTVAPKTGRRNKHSASCRIPPRSFRVKLNLSAYKM